MYVLMVYFFQLPFILRMFLLLLGSTVLNGVYMFPSGDKYGKLWLKLWLLECVCIIWLYSNTLHKQLREKLRFSTYIEDITQWQEDMNFMFEWQEHEILF